MMETLLFRKANAGDLATLTSMISLLFTVEEDFTADEQKQISALQLLLQDTDRACVFVAEFEGRAVAMCSVQLLLSTAEGGYKALVEDVIVSPQFRGRKIGGKLLAQAELWAKANKAKRLDLARDMNNESAQSFYHKYGWSETNLTMMQKKI